MKTHTQSWTFSSFQKKPTHLKKSKVTPMIYLPANERIRRSASQPPRGDRKFTIEHMHGTQRRWKRKNPTSRSSINNTVVGVKKKSPRSGIYQCLSPSFFLELIYFNSGRIFSREYVSICVRGLRVLCALFYVSSSV